MFHSTEILYWYNVVQIYLLAQNITNLNFNLWLPLYIQILGNCHRTCTFTRCEVCTQCSKRYWWTTLVAVLHLNVFVIILLDIKNEVCTKLHFQLSINPFTVHYGISDYAHAIACDDKYSSIHKLIIIEHYNIIILHNYLIIMTVLSIIVLYM